MSSFLSEIFSFIIIFLSFFIVFSTSPIYAILFLILIFCSSGFFLFFFNFDFFGLIFIIIYVGAIAVLFLFIIMMLNIKIKKNFSLKENNFLISGLTLFFLSLIIGICLGIFLEFFLYDNYFDLFMNRNTNILYSIDYLSNITVFGQYFYNFFNIFFILSGLILLVALIGAVSLTLDSSLSDTISLKQLESKQLAKSANVLAYI